MADTPTLELQIRDNSEKAIQGLKRLASSLNDLKTAVSGGLGLTKVANSLEKFSQRFDKAFGPETVAKITNVANALDKIAKAWQTKIAAGSSISQLNKAVKSATPALETYANGTKAATSENGTLKDSNSTVSISFKELVEKIKASMQGIRDQKKSFGDLKGAVSKLISPLDKLITRFNRLLLTRILRTVIKEIGKAFQEGITNVRAYSKAIDGSFNKAMTGAEDALLKMKNSLGAALAPALEALIPVLHTVVGWFIELVNYVNQFISLLTGKATWTRAIDASAAEFEKTKKSVAGTSKEVKNLLADFDELNIIQSEPSGSGGSGGKVDTVDYTTMFEEVGEFDGKLKEIVGWLKDNMGEVKKIAGLIGAALLGWKFAETFTGPLGQFASLFALGATIALTWKLVTLFDNKYLESKDIGWLVADVLTSALGALASKSIIASVLGTGAGYIAAGITLAFSATATVVSVLKSVDISALSKESVTSLIIAGVKYGAAGMFIAKALNSFGITHFGTSQMVMIGAGATLATFGAALAIKATVDSIEGEETEETLAAKAVGSLSLGLGGTLIAKALTNWKYGQALTFGLGVFGITFGATLGIQALVDAVNGEPDVETISKMAVSSLSLGLGGGALAKALKSWKFGKSFAFGLGIMGITLGAMIGIKAYIDEVKGEPSEKVLIEKAVASLALGFGAGKLAGALNEWKFGRSFTFGLGAIGITLGAMFGVQAMIDAVNGEPNEKVFLETAVASLGLGFGGGALAKALKEWKFGKSFNFGLGVVGITFGAMFGVKAMIDAANGEPNEKVFIETAIASLAVGLGSGKLSNALKEWKFGKSFTFGLGVMGITLGAMLGVKATIDAVNGEADEDLFKTTAISSLSMGLGGGTLAKSLLDYKPGKSIIFGLGVMGITIGAEVGLSAIVKGVKDGSVTKDTYKKAALASLGIGPGSALLALALGASPGVAGVVMLGAAVATVAAVVGITTILTSKKEDIQWGNISLTDEEVRTYVQDTFFPKVNVAAKIELANSTVEASEAEKTRLREQVEKLIPTIEKIKAGIDTQNSLAEMKTQLFGADGTGGLMADIQTYASRQQTVISTGISLVPIINDAGENVSQDFLKSGITGWQGVSTYMSDLGTQLGNLFKTSLDRELDDTEKALLEKLTNILNNVTMAITSSQITSDAFADLNIQLADLDKGSFGKVATVYNDYVNDLKKSYSDLYKQEMASFAGLQSFYEAAAKEAFAEGTEEGNAKGREYQALADKYAAKYAELSENFAGSVAASVEAASGKGKELVMEAVKKLWGDSVLSTPEIISQLEESMHGMGMTSSSAFQKVVWEMLAKELGISEEVLSNPSGLAFSYTDFVSKDVLYGVLDEIYKTRGLNTATSMAKGLGLDEWIFGKIAEIFPQGLKEQNLSGTTYDNVMDTIDDPVYDILNDFLISETSEVSDAAKDFLTKSKIEEAKGLIDAINEVDEEAARTNEMLKMKTPLQAYVEASNDWFKRNMELSQLASQRVTTLEDALVKWQATLELGQHTGQITPYREKEATDNIALFTGIIEDLQDGALDSTSLTDMAEAYRLLSVYYDDASEGLKTLIDTLYVNSGLKEQDEIKQLDERWNTLTAELDLKRDEMEALDQEIATYYKLYGGLSPELGAKKTSLQAEIDALVSQSDELQKQLLELTTGEHEVLDGEDGFTITFTPAVEIVPEPIEPVDATDFLDGLEQTSLRVKDYASSIQFSLSSLGGKLGPYGFIPTRLLHLKADGGFVGTGDMFIAREAGPELVGRIGNRTAVANNDQIVSGVANGVAAGQSEQNYLLRQQNEYLRAILAKESTVRVEPSAGWGRFNRQSEQMYARNAGG